MEDKTFKLIKKQFKLMGMKLLTPRNSFANGPDLYAIVKDRVFTIEVKTARKIGKKCDIYQCDPVSENRKKDDFICIVFPSNYILIEPMEQHLKCCATKGSRNLTPMC